MTTSKKVIKEGKHHAKPDVTFPSTSHPTKARKDSRRKKLEKPRKEDFYTYTVVLKEPTHQYQLTSTDRRIRRDTCDERGHHTFIRCPVESVITQYDRETRTTRTLYIRYSWTIWCAECHEQFSFKWFRTLGKNTNALVPEEATEIEWVDATPAERARVSRGCVW